MPKLNVNRICKFFAEISTSKMKNDVALNAQFFNSQTSSFLSKSEFNFQS